MDIYIYWNTSEWLTLYAIKSFSLNLVTYILCHWTAHPQGRRVSLFQALGWKTHASQPEHAAKEEEQEVWTSHQNERKTPGMHSVCLQYCSVILPVYHIYTLPLIFVSWLNAGCFLYVTWRWRFLTWMMISHSALKCRRISYVSTAIVLSAVVTTSNGTFSPIQVRHNPFCSHAILRFRQRDAWSKYVHICVCFRGKAIRVWYVWHEVYSALPPGKT